MSNNYVYLQGEETRVLSEYNIKTGLIEKEFQVEQFSLNFNVIKSFINYYSVAWQRSF